MKRDFTFELYKELIHTLKDQGFSFYTVEHFLKNPDIKGIILRHDVDKLPQNSLEFAEFQNDLGIKGTYYFRIVPQSWNKDIIKSISSLGHEIGYHYEDLSLIESGRKAVGKGKKTNPEREKMLAEIAVESFAKNLEKIRKITPVNTICMHGSPLSNLDSRVLWKYYNYRNFDIIGEPYFDINFENILYLTDTGRKWNGSSYSIRDKASGDKRKELTDFNNWVIKPIQGSLFNMKPVTIQFQRVYDFSSTYQVITSIINNHFPATVLMTFHPQRWTDNKLKWFKELISQNTKNAVKYLIVKYNGIY